MQQELGLEFEGEGIPIDPVQNLKEAEVWAKVFMEHRPDATFTQFKCNLEAYIFSYGLSAEDIRRLYDNAKQDL